MDEKTLSRQLENFKRSLEDKKLIPGNVIYDGHIHRCATVDRPHSQNGWYIAHDDDLVSGVYGDWQTGETWRFCAKTENEMTPEELDRLKDRIQSDKKRQQEEAAKRNAEAQSEAVRILYESMPAPVDHPYLVHKGVTAVGDIRIKADGRLLVPVLDQQGTITSLQFIADGGDKRFLPGGKIKGGYFPIPAANEKKVGPLFICEGYATGATIHQATGDAVLVAFSCGNLLAVSEMARAQYPDRKIVVCADDDTKSESNPGIARATEAALAAKALLAVPTFTDQARGTDFNDMVATEGMEAVKAALAAAEDPSLKHKKDEGKGNAESGLVVYDIDRFLSIDIPPRDYVLHPVIPTQGLVMCYAPRGIGKTYVALSIAYAVASGQRLCKWEALTPRRVLYIDGEMPASTMQERLAAIVAGSPKKLPSPDFLRIITPDMQPNLMPNLAKPEGQSALAPFLKDIELVIIDNLATLCRLGRENEAESWLPVQEWILSMRRRGISVLLIHHANKGGGQRGTSSREDVLDTVISLRRPQDYQPEEGARFEIHLEKARGIVGEDAKPFEAFLKHENATVIWLCRDVEDVELELVESLLLEGKTIRAIADEVGLSKSQVGRLAKKIKEAA
jgi:putative DNA primase/helicase